MGKAEAMEKMRIWISIYDAQVNPSVVNICAKDPQAKDATCLRIMRLLKKKFGEDLQLEYKLPKINKRYKGEIQQVLVPSNMTKNQHTFIIDGALRTNGIVNVGSMTVLRATTIHCQWRGKLTA
jgi:hypothetical protein